MNSAFWQSVVNNLAAIIVAITGLGTMIGGFVMQKRMMDRQNEKLDRNADRADAARSMINTKIDKVTEATNGLVERNATMARSLGVAEGKAAALQEVKNGTPV